MTKKQAFRRCLTGAAAILLCTLPVKAANKVVIVQTNSAGDNVHIIDPATNKVIGEIKRIEVNHGAAVAPDGSRIYISDEAMSALAVVHENMLMYTAQIKLTGHPNKLAVVSDGRRVYEKSVDLGGRRII